MPSKVLLVDDEPHVTASLQRLLRHEPYEILTSASAAEALALLEREAVDIMVVDAKMPGMSGTELLAAVRQRHPQIIGMILTGNPTATLALLPADGVYHFFTKPCDGTELSLVLRQALRHQELMAKTTQLLALMQHQPPQPMSLGQLLSAIDAQLQRGVG